MSAKDAEERFITNFRLLGGPDAEPEKYNLYKGLADLASAIENIERELREVKDFMYTLKTKSTAVHI